MRYVPTTAIEKTCSFCATTFRGMPSEVRTRKFCSQACVGASRRGRRKVKWASIRCRQCKTRFQVTPAWVKNGRRKFCSRACGTKANNAMKRLGIRHTEESRRKMRDAATGKFLRENSSQWKGGRVTTAKGYVFTMVEILPDAERELARKMTASRYVPEHRIVAATTLGRPLTRSEVVHHRNGTKSDNRPENLIVVDRADHSIEHRRVELELLQLRERVSALEAENADLRSRLN